MRVAVCDDICAERERLTALSEDYLRSKSIDAQVCGFGSGEELINAFEKEEYNLVFLDIYMGGITGVETAKRIRRISPDCVIIFTTTSREHGAEAFDVDAFHYLVKPVEKDKFSSVMDKWYDVLCTARTITLKCGRTEREILIRDIIYRRNGKKQHGTYRRAGFTNQHAAVLNRGHTAGGGVCAPYPLLSCFAGACTQYRGGYVAP